MTTVVKDGFGGGGAGVGPRGGRARGKGTGRRVWQIPLLLAGVVAFGFGVRSLVRSIKPVPFETHVKDIRGLLAAGENVKAIEQVNNIAEYYPEKSQQAQLQWLVGDAYYLEQIRVAGEGAGREAGTVRLVGAERKNFEEVVEHYRKAQVLGAEPTAMMEERWGLAAMGLGDAKMAIEKLEAAAGEDEEKLLEHSRVLVAAYLSVGELKKAAGVVDRVMASEKHVGVDDRAWGYAKKIEMALMQRNGGGRGDSLEKAVAEGKQAVNGMAERDPAGRVLLWIGRAEFEEGKLDLAKTDLEGARGRFLVHHLDDGRAAVLLGKIAVAQGRAADAGKLFQEVVMGQAGTPVFVAARFGRGEVLAMSGENGEAMEADYRFVMKELDEKSEVSSQKSELVTMGEVRASLEEVYQRDNSEKKLKEGLAALALLKESGEKMTAKRMLEWATAREGLAREVGEKQEAGSKKQEAEGLLKLAAEDYLAHSKLMTLNDEVSGNSLWKAAQLFDEAGETMKSIEVYDRFTRERPRDPRVPEGMLAVGRLYQSVGMFEKAIPVYRKNIEKNPKTPAAYTSAVNVAHCYMMMGAGGEGEEENFKKAEAALLSLVQDNEDLLPTANEYRVSLFTLGELYYRHRRWADAILRLEESVERYPEDKGVPRATFMLAETYKKSAEEIAEAIKAEAGGPRVAALAKARVERFERAAGLFGKVIAMLDADGVEGSAEPVARGPKGDGLTALEGEFLRTSYMDRAGCSFLLGDYAGAIKLYDVAATRFSQDQAAADAYVQIVNAYQAMKQPQQAAAAAERGRWVLKRIPEDAFGKGMVKLTRGYYEGLLAEVAGSQ